MSARKSEIEFLPQEEWEKTSIGRFIKWSLSIGRYIVIFTELIVVTALISRFKLDRDLSDLNEQIKQQQAIVSASSQFENEFRLLQNRLNKADTLSQNLDQPNILLRELGETIPLNVTLSNLNINNNEITFNAESLDETGIATLINKLEKSPNFGNINVGQISSSDKEKATILFSLKFDYQPK